MSSDHGEVPQYRHGVGDVAAGIVVAPGDRERRGDEHVVKEPRGAEQVLEQRVPDNREAAEQKTRRLRAPAAPHEDDEGDEHGHARDRPHRERAEERLQLVQHHGLV
jgi:hypothetical protein